MNLTPETRAIYERLFDERDIAAYKCAALLHDGCTDQARSFAHEWQSLTNDIAALNDQGNKK